MPCHHHHHHHQKITKNIINIFVTLSGTIAPSQDDSEEEFRGGGSEGCLIQPSQSAVVSSGCVADCGVGETALDLLLVTHLN